MFVSPTLIKEQQENVLKWRRMVENRNTFLDTENKKRIKKADFFVRKIRVRRKKPCQVIMTFFYIKKHW